MNEELPLRELRAVRREIMKTCGNDPKRYFDRLAAEPHAGLKRARGGGMTDPCVRAFGNVAEVSGAYGTKETDG